MNINLQNPKFLSKYIPAVPLFYNEQTNKWTLKGNFELNENLDEIAVNGSIDLQKLQFKYMFIYDENINDWRPMKEGDI